MKKLTRIILTAGVFLLLAAGSSWAGLSIGEMTLENASLPGQEYSGTIAVRNTGNETAEANVYLTDYLFYADGREIYGEPGKDPRSNAGWLSFSPKRLTIPPKETAEINYSIRVPEDPTLTGSYWCLLMIEAVPPRASEHGKADAPALMLKTVVRYGIQIVTHIGDTGEKNLRFFNIKSLTTDLTHSLQLDVEDTGERMFHVKMSVELYDEKGISFGKHEGKNSYLFPKTSGRFLIDLGPIPQGTYKALVVADCGGDDLFGASYALKIDQ